LSSKIVVGGATTPLAFSAAVPITKKVLQCGPKKFEIAGGRRYLSCSTKKSFLEKNFDPFQKIKILLYVFFMGSNNYDLAKNVPSLPKAFTIKYFLT